MQNTFARALFAAAITMVAACSDQAPAPTGLTPTRDAARSTITGPKADGHGFGFNGTASGFPTGSVFL